LFVADVPTAAIVGSSAVRAKTTCERTVKPTRKSELLLLQDTGLHIASETTLTPNMNRWVPPVRAAAVVMLFGD
jgi:hypothetical protein